MLRPVPNPKEVTRIFGKKTLIGIAAAILAAVIAVPAHAATSEPSSPIQSGETTTSVITPSYVTTASITPSSSVDVTPTPDPGGDTGRPSQNPIPGNEKPKGESLVAKAQKAIVPSRARLPKTVVASSYGGGSESQWMARGGKTTDKLTVVVNGKKKRVYVAIVASKSLPINTVIQITYHGRTTWLVVRDRGPYISGRALDIGPRGQNDLGFSGVAKVKVKVLGKLKKGYNYKRFPGYILG